MYQYEEKKKPSVLKLIFNVLFFIAFAMFSIITISTGDPLWFSTAFNEQPNEIMVYCYGENVTITPNNPHYNELTSLFNENFSGYKNWDSLSLSEDTWEYYQNSEDMVVLIFSYPETVRVHSTYKYFSGVDTLILPIDGRHSQTNAVFGMTNEVPASGAMHIPDKTPVSNYVGQSGLCPTATASSN